MELDLFGKLARQTEASKWEALATEQDLPSYWSKSDCHYCETLLATRLFK